MIEKAMEKRLAPIPKRMAENRGIRKKRFSMTGMREKVTMEATIVVSMIRLM